MVQLEQGMFHRQVKERRQASVQNLGGGSTADHAVPVRLVRGSQVGVVTLLACRVTTVCVRRHLDAARRVLLPWYETYRTLSVGGIAHQCSQSECLVQIIGRSDCWIKMNG